MIAIAPHPSIELRLQELNAAAAHSTPEAACRVLAAVHVELGGAIEAVKCRLLATTLDWADEQKAEARWIYDSNRRFAALSLQITESLRRKSGTDDPQALEAIALTLLYMGESMKWEIVTGAQVPRDYRALHALMRHLVAAGRQHSPVRLEVGGRSRACTLESLYFRALLLARYASGILSCAQIEIFDEWMWMWAPVLRGVAAPPAGSALRADLDSSDGLRRGPREGEGMALYLPQAPIEAAFQSLIENFHAGRIVPEEGVTASLRIEEHVAVLDVLRRALRASMDEPVARAARQHVGQVVEVHVGLASIEQSGFEPHAPAATAAVALATVDGVPRATSGQRERESALGAIYDRPRCMVNLANVSGTGVGLEGSHAQCDAMVVGSLLGMRITPGGPLVIGAVTRNIVAPGLGRVVVGVRRISSEAKMVGVSKGGPEAPVVPMLWIQGDDASGSRDGYLVSERAYDEALTYEVRGVQNAYSFRFNRVRERGRGWILAGFEVLGARRLGTGIAL
jgi:hypothetical protein